MKAGLRWVLGDGRSINIFKDRWLRGNPNFCVDHEVSNLADRNETVSAFFMGDRRAWDETKVRKTFSYHDAEAILAVRIPQNSTLDRLAWVHSKDGQYLVKSAYHYWYSIHSVDVSVQQSSGWG